jgi:hypothetical protein|nr:MAG TPA: TRANSCRIPTIONAL REPRESSOR COPG REPRESSOR, DNA-BINDING PROTEIN, PROTEIN-DNA.95A [Caudoviricetes sp.]
MADINNRICLSDNLIERIKKICDRKSITFSQFCENAIYNRVMLEEDIHKEFIEYEED